MKCLKPTVIPNRYFNGFGTITLSNPQFIEVPCGHCRECSRQRTTETMLRLRHEAYYSQMKVKDSGVFVTLTYSPVYFNADTGDVVDTTIYPKTVDSIVERRKKYVQTKRSCTSLGFVDLQSIPLTHGKSDFQKFMKRVRRYLEYDGFKYTLRYYAVAEFGDNYHRKHYHAIILGAPYSILEKYIKKAWRLCDWDVQSPDSIKPLGDISQAVSYMTKYMSKGFSDEWYNSQERMDVVSRYKCPRSYKSKYSIYLKELNKAKIAYLKKHFLPFSLRSMGLGKQFALDNAFKLFNDQCIQDGEFTYSIPKYYKHLVFKSLSDSEEEAKILSQDFFLRSMDKRQQHCLELSQSEPFRKFVGEKNSQNLDVILRFDYENFQFTDNYIHYMNEKLFYANHLFRAYDRYLVDQRHVHDNAKQYLQYETNPLENAI